MKSISFIRIFVSFTVLSFVIFSCKKEAEVVNPVGSTDNGLGKLTLKFDNIIGNEDLKLNTSYTNPVTKESFNLLTLQYFISNIKLKTAEGKVFTVPQNDSYFFVNEGNVSSQTITLKDIPKGDYSELTFTIGVDSTQNVMSNVQAPSGLQAGIAQGMYWSWTTGYVFLMIEGVSPQLAKHPEGTEFMYHVGGGNSKIFNNIKVKTLSFGTDKATVSSSKTPEVMITMDVMKVFNGTSTNLKFVDAPVIMYDPRTTKIANNYNDAFSYKQLKNN